MCLERLIATHPDEPAAAQANRAESTLSSPTCDLRSSRSFVYGKDRVAPLSG